MAKQKLSEVSLMYKRLKQLYPQAKEIEVNYISGDYLDRSRVEYLVDGVVIDKYTEVGYYQ